MTKLYIKTSPLETHQTFSMGVQKSRGDWNRCSINSENGQMPEQNTIPSKTINHNR